MSVCRQERQIEDAVEPPLLLPIRGNKKSSLERVKFPTSYQAAPGMIHGMDYKDRIMK